MRRPSAHEAKREFVRSLASRAWANPGWRRSWLDSCRTSVVLAGASHPYGQRLPLAALAEAILSALDLPADAEPALIRRAIGAALRRNGVEGDEAVAARAQLERVLGLAEAAAGAEVAGRPGGTALDPRLSARGAITAITAGRPGLVILDDVHWATDDQLALLRDLAETPWPEPLLILALSRPEPDDWRRDIPTINLAGLGPSNARAVIETSVGGTVPMAVVRRLIERADGNPLFLEESARMLVERGDLTRRGKSWALDDPDALERVPVSLRQLIAARLDRLPASAKRIVQDAAVGGQTTWDRLLARLSTAADPSSTESELEDALAELEARDILRRQPASAVRGAVELEFKHVVICDVAYESLPRAARALRHEWTADWLRQALGEQGVAAIAHHYERAWELGRTAVRSDEPSRAAAMAASYVRRWADSIFSAQPRLALSLYERGLGVSAVEPAAVDRLDVAGLEIGRAEALSEAGRHREAIEAAQAGLAVAEADQLHSMEGYALVALARANSDLGEVGLARDLIERALSIFGEAGDPLGEGRAYHRLAEARRFEGLAGQVSAYQRAYQLYGRAGATRERGMVAEDVAYVMTIAGGRQATVWLERASRLAELSGDERGQAATRRAAAYAALTVATSIALGSAREARAPAEAIGHRWIEVDTLLIEALVRSAAGTPTRRWPSSSRLLAIADSVGARHLRALVLGAGARAAQRDGHPRRAWPGCARCARRSPNWARTWKWPRSTCWRRHCCWNAARGISSTDHRARASESPAIAAGASSNSTRRCFAAGPCSAPATPGRCHRTRPRRRPRPPRRRNRSRVAGRGGAAPGRVAGWGGQRRGRRAPSTPLVSSLTRASRPPSTWRRQACWPCARAIGLPRRLSARRYSGVATSGLTVWQARAEQMRADALRATNRRSAANASARRHRQSSLASAVRYGIR